MLQKLFIAASILQHLESKVNKVLRRLREMSLKPDESLKLSFLLTFLAIIILLLMAVPKIIFLLFN